MSNIERNGLKEIEGKFIQAINKKYQCLVLISRKAMKGDKMSYTASTYSRIKFYGLFAAIIDDRQNHFSGLGFYLHKQRG